jgi:hypothetical protein
VKKLFTFSPFRTMYKRSQPFNFLRVNFLDTFQRIRNWQQILRFFTPVMKIFTKNTFGVILALFAYPHWDRRVIQPDRFRKHYCTVPPNCQPPLQCGKIFLLYCSLPPLTRNQEKLVTYIKERSSA